MAAWVAQIQSAQNTLGGALLVSVLLTSDAGARFEHVFTFMEGDSAEHMRDVVRARIAEFERASVVRPMLRPGMVFDITAPADPPDSPAEVAAKAWFEELRKYHLMEKALALGLTHATLDLTAQRAVLQAGFKPAYVLDPRFEASEM